MRARAESIYRRWNDLRRDPLTYVFMALLLLSLCPIWLVPYQPLADLGNHMAASSIWVHIDDPTWNFSQYYALDLGLNPYWGYYLPMRLIGPLVGISVANRIVLSIYALMVPLGFSWLAVRFGRSAWLGIFGVSFIWTFCLNIGFIHTSLGLALTLVAIAAFDAFCERPTFGRGLGVWLLGVAVYFCHVVPFLLAIGCMGLIGLLHRDRSAKRILGRLGVWTAVVAAGVLVSLLGHGKGMGAGPARYTFSWDAHPVTMLLQLFHWTWNKCIGPEDEILAGILVFGWLALVLSGRRDETRRSWHEYRAHACVFAAIAGYLILPRSVLTPAYSWGVKYRIAAWALLFLGLLIPGAIAGARRWLLLPVVAAGLGFTIDTWVHWAQANQYAPQFADVIAAIPKNARPLFITPLPFRSAKAVTYYEVPWPQMYQAQRGGYNPWLFDDFPIRFRARYPAPSWRTMAFNWDQHSRYWDYVVTFKRSARDVFGAHESEVVAVKIEGPWAAWKLPGPRVDRSPGPVYPSGWAEDPRWRPPAP